MKVDLNLKIDGVIEEGHGFEIESDAEVAFLAKGVTQLFLDWLEKREELRKPKIYKYKPDWSAEAYRRFFAECDEKPK
jgi:hypothetical protein